MNISVTQDGVVTYDDDNGRRHAVPPMIPRNGAWVASDTSALPPAVRDACAAAWTDDVLAAWVEQPAPGAPTFSAGGRVGSIADLRGLGVSDADILAAARQTADDRVYLLARQRLDAAVERYSVGEQILWGALESEARIYLDGGSAPIPPLLAARAAAGDTTANDYANRVVVKADALRAYSTAVIGQRDRHRAALAALTTPEALVAYDVTAGWPIL